jgi:hypothetical protein
VLVKESSSGTGVPRSYCSRLPLPMLQVPIAALAMQSGSGEMLAMDLARRRERDRAY